MWYITWIELHNGYYVKWKSKTEDEFSDNWIVAKKYKSITAAISRLHLRLDKHMLTIDSFIEANLRDIQTLRGFKLSKLLDQTQDLRNFLYTIGRIDKVDEKGNFMGDAIDEIIEWITNNIKNNIKSKEEKQKKYQKMISDAGLKTDSTVDVTTKEYADEFFDFFK